MKKAVFSICLLVVVFFCGCSDYNTPKSSELSGQYDFYQSTIQSLCNDMKITPEQADEVFLVLVNCGLNEKTTNIFERKYNDEPFYEVWYGGNSLSVYLNNAVIEKVIKSDKAVYPESLVEAERLAEEEAAAEVTELAKNVAIVMDSQLIEIVKNSQEVILLLQDGIALLEEDNAIASLYSLADTAEASQQSLQYAASSVRDKDNKDYVNAVENYVVNGQIICSKIKEYLDDGSLEGLNDAQRRLESSETYYGDVLDARRDYLSSQGLSNEEIADIFAE